VPQAAGLVCDRVSLTGGRIRGPSTPRPASRLSEWSPRPAKVLSADP